MSGLLFLVEALGIPGPLRRNSDTIRQYYTRGVYVNVKVMAGITIMKHFEQCDWFVLL